MASKGCPLKSEVLSNSNKTPEVTWITEPSSSDPSLTDTVVKF